VDDRIFLNPINLSSDCLKLFVFPHAGSGAGQYYKIAEELAEYNINTFIVRYPGRESRINDKLELLEELAEEAASLITECKGRFALFGHSLGGYVAFETTRRLINKGTSPEILFLSGQTSPHSFDRKYYTECLKKSDTEFMEWIQTTYKHLPSEITQSPDMEEMLLKILRTDYKYIASYTPDKDVFADIQGVLINGRQDKDVIKLNPADWKNHLKGIAGTHYFSGGHFYLFNNIEGVCGIIAGYFPEQ